MELGVDLALAGLSGILLILLSTIQSAYEQISDLSRHILKAESRSDRKRAFFDELMRNEERFQVTLLLGIYALVVAIAILTLENALNAGIPNPVPTSLVIALLAVFASRLLIPRVIAQNSPERVLIGLLPLIKPLYRIAAVVTVPTVRLLDFFYRSTESSEEDEEPSFDETMSDLQALIDVGAEEGIIEESEGLMIQSIVELSETLVNEVMTPRTQIIAISASATAIEARDLMIETRRSRLPVYSDHIDNIEGVLYVRDLLAAWHEDRDAVPITDLMRPAYFVPELKPVADLLEEMRKSQVQIALVIDEYGAVAGLITIEDLLEEIVGEIEDEDVEVPSHEPVEVCEDGTMLVKGSTEIRKIELHFKTEIEADDFTTVAGLIINELGHLPSSGERIELKGLEFEVLEADNRRVNLVRLRTVLDPASESPST